MKVKKIIFALVALILFSCTPEPIRVVSVTLNPKALTLDIGKSESLTATISPKDADNITVIWFSNNASIAQVTSDGIVTAISPGEARISVKTDDGGLSDFCDVTVPDPFIFVDGVSLNQTSLTLHEGEWAELCATITPADANNPSLQWTSNNPEVAQITSEGIVLALKSGTAKITVTTVDGGKSATCQITVTERVTGLKLEPEKSEIYVSDTITVAAKLEPKDANVNVRFTSTNPEVVSVDSETGNVRAVAAGYAIVCAATDYKGLVAFCEIRVRDRVKSVIVKSTAKDVNVGETVKMTTAVIPGNLPDIQLTWSSSNPDVATIDANGEVAAKARGTTSITATVQNGTNDSKSGTCDIRVIQPVTSISVSPTSLEIFEGEEVALGNLTIALTPDNADDTTWTAKSLDENIVTVSDGKIKAKTKGHGTVRFSPANPASDNVKADVLITVKAKVSDIRISGNKSIKVGETLQLKAEVLPEDANNSVKWESSHPEVATVDQQGLVTASKTKSGTTKITVTSEENANVSKSCEVVVQDIAIERIELNKTFLSLEEGETAVLEAKVYPDTTNLNKGVDWSVDDINVATVTDGVVTAVAPGETVIIATSKGDSSKVKRCTVVVTAKKIAVTGITLNKSNLELEIGQYETLTATVTPANATDKAVNWSSSNSMVATVDSDGKVTALSSGTTKITVTTQDGGKMASCIVTVPEPIVPAIPVSSITLSQTTATLTFGQSVSVNVTVMPSNATDPSWECSSSDTAIASVTKTATGATIRAGNKEGNASITFQSTKHPNISASFQITVKAQIVPVSQITISPSRLDLYLGQTKQVKATAIGKGGAEPDNKTIIWSVPQGGNVTIDQKVSATGFVNVTGVNEGNRRLIASSEDGYAEAYIYVNVTKNKVASVTLPVNALTLKKGEKYDLNVTVTADDPSFRASNPNVSWSTSDSKVAIVNSGRISAIASGTTTITVSSTDDKSKTATCIVTVLDSNAGNGGSEGLDFDDWTFD